MHYGKLMAEMIDWAGLTVVEAAKRAKISESTLRRQIRRVAPTFDVFFAIVIMTKYPIGNIVGEYSDEDAAMIKLIALS